MIFSRWLLKGRLKKALDLLNCGMNREATGELKSVLSSLGGREGEDERRKRIIFYLAECYMTIGDEKLEDKDFRGALSEFEAAAALEVKFPDLYFRIGKACMALDEFDKAEQALNRAIDWNPLYVNACLLRAALFTRQKKPDLAVEEYKRLHAQGVLCDDALYRQGIQALENGDQADGVALLKESFREKPDPVQGLYAKGMKCYKNKDYTRAIQEFKQALEQHPDYPDIHNILGVAYCSDGSYEEAESAFRKAMELNDRYLEPRLNLAFLYDRMQQKEEARALFQEVLLIEPRNVIALDALENLKTR